MRPRPSHSAPPRPRAGRTRALRWVAACLLALPALALGARAAARPAREPANALDSAEMRYRVLLARAALTRGLAASLSERGAPPAGPEALPADQQLLVEFLGDLGRELELEPAAASFAARLALLDAADAVVAELAPAVLARPDVQGVLSGVAQRCWRLADMLASETAAAPAAELDRHRFEWRYQQGFLLRVESAADLRLAASLVRSCADILAARAFETGFGPGSGAPRLSAWVDEILAAPLWSELGAASESPSAWLADLMRGRPSESGLTALLASLRTGLERTVLPAADPERRAAGPAAPAEPRPSAPVSQAALDSYLLALDLVHAMARNLERTNPAPLPRERFEELCDVFDGLPSARFTVLSGREWQDVANPAFEDLVAEAGAPNARGVQTLPAGPLAGATARVLDQNGDLRALPPSPVDGSGLSWCLLPGFEYLFELVPGDPGSVLVLRTDDDADQTVQLPPKLPAGFALFRASSRADAGGIPTALVAISAEPWTRAELLQRLNEGIPEYIWPRNGDKVDPNEDLYRFLCAFLPEASAELDLRTVPGRATAQEELTAASELARIAGSALDPGPAGEPEPLAAVLVRILSSPAFRSSILPRSAVSDWIEGGVAQALGWSDLDSGTSILRLDGVPEAHKTYVLREAVRPFLR